MGRFDKIKLTRKGLRLQAKAQTGEQLIIKEIVVGTGYLPEETDVLDMTELISPVPDAVTNIIGNTVTGDGYSELETRVSGGNTAFYLREIGIIAVDPDEGDILYAYTNAGDYADFMPAASDNITVQEITLVTAIGNADNVTVNITLTPEVTREEFEKLKNKIHVDIMYRNEDKKEPNTIYFIIDENAQIEPEKINAVSYDNVIYGSAVPEQAAEENWFETEGGGETHVTDTSKIVMQNGRLTVLKDPDENTTFLNE